MLIFFVIGPVLDPLFIIYNRIDKKRSLALYFFDILEIIKGCADEAGESGPRTSSLFRILHSIATTC